VKLKRAREENRSKLVFEYFALALGAVILFIFLEKLLGQAAGVKEVIIFAILLTAITFSGWLLGQGFNLVVWLLHHCGLI
jgi:hypothetical protein